MLRTLVLMAVAGGLVGTEHTAYAQRAPVGFYSMVDTSATPRIVDVSRNGEVAVGSISFHQSGAINPFSWRYSTGARSETLPAGHSTGQFRAVSGDGLVAFADMFPPSGTPVLARYGPNGLIDTFAGMPGWQETTVMGADRTGSTFVGRARLVFPPTSGTPFVWRNGQYRQLTGIPGYGSRGEAVAVSDDGQRVVGMASGDLTTNGFRWTEASGYEMLPRLPGVDTGYVFGASGNADWVVGHSGNRPVRWGPDDSVLNLDPAGLFSSADAWAVSDDGSIVIGYGRFEGRDTPFIWRASAGMSLLTDFLTESGITLPPDVRLVAAASMSSDGAVLAGHAVTLGNGHGWVAVVPAPASFAALVVGLACVVRRSRRRGN